MNKIDYGFSVGDPVWHVGDTEVVGFVIELDSEYDQGGVTTCKVVWDAGTLEEAVKVPREDQDIQWTNKLLRVQ